MCGTLAIPHSKPEWICPEGCRNPKDKSKRALVDYTDGHLHKMAKRKMVKVLLAHIWLVWRTMEGLPTESPWIIGREGHSHIIPPPNWPMDV